MQSNDVAAFQKEKLRELSEKPNTTVYETEHTEIREPTAIDDVSKVLEKISIRLAQYDCDKNDFFVRKDLLKDDEILNFQRKHPKMYWMVTDREKMAESKYRGAISALLEVRRRVERGEVPSGEEADAAATRTIIDALSS